MRYIPSVSRAEDSVKTAGEEMKLAGMLAPTTDTAALAKRAFARLEGVSDEWIQKVEVEKVAGGQTLSRPESAMVDKMTLTDLDRSCCLVAEK